MKKTQCKYDNYAIITTGGMEKFAQTKKFFWRFKNKPYLCSVLLNYNTISLMKTFATSVRRQVLACLLILLSAGIAGAQLLWRVSGDNAHTSYIFGTHHLAPVAMLDSIAGLDAAMQNADVVMGEIDMSPANMGRMQQLILGAVQAPADSTLSRVMSPRHLARLDSLLQSYSGGMLSAAALEGYTPAFVATQLEVLQAVAKMKANPMQTLDETLQRRARGMGKEVRGLETAELQIAKLFGTPIARQAAQLGELLDLPDCGESLSERLYNAYLAGDLDAVGHLIYDEQYANDADAVESLVVDRNNAWVDIIIGAVPTMSLFIAVGAGHLPGAKGLISQLRGHGLTVTPVAGGEM